MTDEDIRQLIQKHGLFHGTIALGIVMDASHLRQFASLIEENAASSERDECAKVCEALLADTRYEAIPQEARVSFLKARDAIRARGNK